MGGQARNRVQNSCQNTGKWQSTMHLFPLSHSLTTTIIVCVCVCGMLVYNFYVCTHVHTHCIYEEYK